MKLILQKIYNYGVLTLMICVQFLLLNSNAYSQVSIDTFIYIDYTINYGDNSLTYFAISEEGDSLYFKKSAKRKDSKPKRSVQTGKLQNCEDVFFRDGKLYSLDSKIISDSIYSGAFGKIGDSFIVLKNDEVILTDLAGNEKLICSLGKIRLTVRRNNFFIENKLEKRVYIYDDEANITGIIDDVPFVYDNIFPNEYLIVVGILDGTVNAITDVFDLQGNLLARGDSEGAIGDLILFEDERKHKFYFFKDKKIELSPEWKSMKIRFEFLEITFMNGLKGIFDSNLDTIIKPEFTDIGILNDVFEKCNYLCKDFFIAEGVDGQVSMFDMKGRQIEIKEPLEVGKRPWWMKTVYRFEFGDGLLFYINRNHNKFKIYDDQWNYLATEKFSKDFDGYYFSSNVPYWRSAPISLLAICKNRYTLRENEFYVVKKNIRKRRWNICDINGNIILNEAHANIEKLDRNTFMIRHLDIKPYIIRINAN